MTFDTTSWNKGAWAGKTASEYCAACLIDENPAGAEKTKDKCSLPYKKPGSSQINKSALRTMATGHGLPAVKASSESKTKAANWIINQWPKAFGQPAPENIYRIAGKQRPTSKAKFIEDKSGIWFLGVISNNFMDREGEILSDKSHEDYVSWANEKGVKPPIVFMHQPQVNPTYLAGLMAALEAGILDVKAYNKAMHDIYASTSIAETKLLVHTNGFVIVVGKVLDNKTDVVRRMRNKDIQWGMSHGFFQFDIDGNIIDKYRSFEFTVLETDIAANSVTTALFNGEVMDKKTLTDENRELLDELFGDGTADQTEEATEKARKLLQSILASKQVETSDEPVEDEAPETEAPAEKETTETLVEQLTKAFNLEGLRDVINAQAQAIVDLSDTVENLETKVKELQVDDDTKIAHALTPFNWETVGADSKQVGDETEEELLDKLKDGLPEPKISEKELAENPHWNLFLKPFVSN